MAAGTKGMRLICPNCDAQYEVASDAIPAGGRDVQCSNCGHGWYQLPEIVAAGAEPPSFGAPEELGYRTPPPPAPKPPPAEAAPAVAEPAPTAPEPAASEPAPVPEPAEPQPASPVFADLPESAEPAETLVIPGAAEEDEEEAAPAPPPPRRSLDESLLAVLREEAEREAEQRKAEAPPSPPAPPPAAQPRPAAAETAPRNRDLLPDIEEINSTLRASNERRHEVDNLPALAEERPSGFGSGFFLMLVLAAGLAAAYVMAPKISEQIPSSAPAMQAYVGAVDQGRIWLDGLMQQAIAALRDMQG